MTRPPWESPCHCHSGYKCPYCEGEEKRKAKEEAQRKQAEKMIQEMRDGDGDD